MSPEGDRLRVFIVVEAESRFIVAITSGVVVSNLPVAMVQASSCVLVYVEGV